LAGQTPAFLYQTPANLVGFSRCGGVNKAKLLATSTIVNNAKPNCCKFAAMNLIAFSKGVYLLYYILNKISQ